MSYTIDESIKAESKAPNLQPGIHTVQLVGIAPQYTTKDGRVLDAIMFEFSGSKGKYTHLEFTPENEDKAINTMKRIKHIMAQYLPKDECVATGETWKALGEDIIRRLGNTYKGVNVQIKLIGSVYQNKAKVNFPKYIGFIANPAKEDYVALKFSGKENESNKDYEEFKAEETSGTPDADLPLSDSLSSDVL